VLLATQELNIFDKLADKPMAAQDLVGALGFDPKHVERLIAFFRKCIDKLVSGCAIVVHDFLMNNDYQKPVLSGFYNLTLLEGVPLSDQDMVKRLQAAQVLRRRGRGGA
jgi:hypothetical protein